MSADLQWLLIRKSNCFIHKALPEGPILSREPGNLLNVHSFKYSGLANNKAIDVSASADGNVVVTKKTADGLKVASTLKSFILRKGTASRRAAKIVAKETATKGFRSDLRAAAVSRATTLVRVSHASAYPKKTITRGPRGRKVVKVSAEVVEDDE